MDLRLCKFGVKLLVAFDLKKEKFVGCNQSGLREKIFWIVKAKGNPNMSVSYYIKGLLISLLLCSVTIAEEHFLADRVLVKKSEKKLYLVRDGVNYREFLIALGPRPRGQKLYVGDERTPEGSYILDFKNEKSDFYKAIHISYPNEQDIKRAEEIGVNPGGAIMIHGIPNKTTLPPALIQKFNWTDGCIAVTNEDMDEIWLAVEPGTPIDILP